MRYTENDFRSIFQMRFNGDDWTRFLAGFFEGARLRAVPEEFDTPTDNERGFFLGEYNTSDHYSIGLFRFDVKAASVARKRVGLRNLVKSLINPRWGTFDAALTVFVSETDWRLSFICDIKEEKTAPKRFTYVFGDEGMLYRTPVKRLYDIQGKVTFTSLKKAFSVKELSDEFFYEYRDIYADFVQYITGNRYVKKTQGSGYELKSFPGEPQNMTFYQALGCDDKRARDFVKKMMGRITFLYFLQQKGWMCGDKNYMLHLFEKSDDKDFYLKRVLVPLFFGILNTKPAEREAIFTAHGWNHALRQEWESIPYLNGGLFDPDDEDRVVDACQTHIFRKKDFEALFEFFSHYNFTIDENDPSDAEVGVDPEMLGKIFESLLEDNKDKGAFYTPKEIVQYMCQESLVAYLVTKTGIGEDRLHAFVQTPDECVSSFNKDEQYKVLDGILSVKICDPAIGSGAFPIGLLNELVRCKEAIYGDKKGRADIKREIIRDNIYGVDIEKGAVDIARLRFWLSLVVDEDTPTPLPNLNYKIMQGNSLLEWYDGVDLSKLTDMAAADSLFGGGRAEQLKQDLADYLKRYFGESDHKKQSELKGKITATIKEILDIAGVSIPDNIDIAENNQFFLWHTWYNEVFVKNGGFDICIGNPPYIRLQNDTGMHRLGKNGKLESIKFADLYTNVHYDTFSRSGDIYCLFYEVGFRLLNRSGHLCFITSNKWMKSGYGESLRTFLSTEVHALLLIDFAGYRVFENATVDTNILIGENNKNKGATLCYKTNWNNDSINNLSFNIKNNGVNISFTPKNMWLILNEKERHIKELIESCGNPLSNWDVSINYGIKTGCSKAYVVSSDEKERILAMCQSEDEKRRTELLFVPLLRGKDVDRYSYKWANIWLINVHNGVRGKLPRIRIEEYPTLKAHLEQFKEELSKRADKGDSPYNLRNCAYLEDFYKQKVVWTPVNSEYRFTIVPEGVFMNNSLFMITGENIETICAFANSNILKYYLSLFSGDSYQYGSADFFASLPLPRLDARGANRIKELVCQISRNIEQHLPTQQLEEDIENTLLGYYNFSPEEIRIIESKQ